MRNGEATHFLRRRGEVTQSTDFWGWDFKRQQVGVRAGPPPLPGGRVWWRGDGAPVTRGDGAASVSEDAWTVMGPGELGTTSFFRSENWRMPKKSHSVMSDSLRPHGLHCPWNSPGQNTGVGSLSLLQGIFPTQESNQDLLHCRQILYQLS